MITTARRLRLGDAPSLVTPAVQSHGIERERTGLPWRIWFAMTVGALLIALTWPHPVQPTSNSTATARATQPRGGE